GGLFQSEVEGGERNGLVPASEPEAHGGTVLDLAIIADDRLAGTTQQAAGAETLVGGRGQLGPRGGVMCRVEQKRQVGVALQRRGGALTKVSERDAALGLSG